MKTIINSVSKKKIIINRHNPLFLHSEIHYYLLWNSLYFCLLYRFSFYNNKYYYIYSIISCIYEINNCVKKINEINNYRIHNYENIQQRRTEINAQNIEVHHLSRSSQNKQLWWVQEGLTSLKLRLR